MLCCIVELTIFKYPWNRQKGRNGRSLRLVGVPTSQTNRFTSGEEKGKKKKEKNEILKKKAQPAPPGLQKAATAAGQDGKGWAQIDE